MTTVNTFPATQDTAITYLMKNYASYNLWANTTLISWLKAKPVAELEQEVASSFPSIKLTILHIWQTERYWLSIIKNVDQVPYSEFSGTVYDAFDALLKTSAELATHISTMTDET